MMLEVYFWIDMIARALACIVLLGIICDYIARNFK